MNIKKIIFNYRKNRLIKLANKKAKLTGYRYLVIGWHGKLILSEKKYLKTLISKRKFKKGTTIQQLEAASIYVTPISVIRNS